MDAYQVLLSAWCGIHPWQVGRLTWGQWWMYRDQIDRWLEVQHGT